MNRDSIRDYHEMVLVIWIDMRTQHCLDIAFSYEPT